MSKSQTLKKPRTLPVNQRVVVSWLFPDKVDGQFMGSMMNLLAYDLHIAGGRILNGGGMVPITSGPNIATARNKQVERFLEMPADWLWILDSDMAFEPDTLERLMVEADPVKAPIVGGLCFGKTHTPAKGLHYWATLYQFNEDMQTFRLEDWPENTMLQVNATGTACLLIHRSVLTAVKDKFGERAPWIWFEELNNNGHIYSEDVMFCIRAQQCGFPIFVHTGVEITHMKPEAITGDTFRRWKSGWGES